MRRWLASVVREAMGVRVDEEAETEQQSLDRWADELTGEVLVGETLLLEHALAKRGTKAG